MTTPSPTPWSEKSYDLSDGADGFNSLPRLMGSSDFPADDFGDANYWRGVIATASLPIACFIIGIPIFWFFLCCRSGCCSCLCGRCKRCSDFLCGCCGKDVCCPDVSHIEDQGGFGACCMCRKDKTKVIHGGICRGRPITARLVLIGIFVALGLINLGVQDGMDTLSLASDDLESILVSVGDIFRDLEKYGAEFKAEGVDIINASQILQNTCSSQQVQDGAAELEPAGSLMKSAGKSIDSLVNGFDTKVYNFADRVDESTSGSVWAMVSTAMLFGAIFSVLGLVGTACIELKSLFCRWSSNVLALTQIIGVILLLILSLVVSVEMLIGLPVGDFCAAGPTDTLVDIVFDEIKNVNQSEILSYFLLNDGDNPFDKFYDEAVDAGKEANATLSEYRPLFTASSACCPGFSNSWGAQDFVDNCEFYFNSGDCTPTTPCTTTSGASGMCVPSADCDVAAYNGLRSSLSYVLIDQDGPIAGVFDLISFETLNAPLTKLLNSALCTHTVDGVYILFSVHMTVLVLTYVALFFVSLLRTPIVGTQCCFVAEKKHQTEFSKTWEVEGEVEMYDHGTLKSASGVSPTLRAQL